MSTTVQHSPTKKQEAFRDYAAEARACVRELYRLNHSQQTVAFVQKKKAEYLPLRHARMGIWEALGELQKIVDDADPDLDLSQLDHALQTAEALRRAGEPRPLVLAGLIHDLGKVLCLFGEPQWAVVGDTFPVGCTFAAANVYPELFAENPDNDVAQYQTELGIYEEGCGFDRVHMSWGHDEYLYQVVKDYLPEEAAYVIRYHSFYPWHRGGAYRRLMDDNDRRLEPWIHRFNPYDLYSKSDQRLDVGAVRPYYDELIAEFLPPLLQW
jgi:inositol oxygenase